MKTRLVITALTLFVILSGCIASKNDRLASKYLKTYNTVIWEYSIGLTIGDFFIRLYLPHAVALLEGEAQIVKDGFENFSPMRLLEGLPGVNCVILLNREDCNIASKGGFVLASNLEGLDLHNELIKQVIDKERLYRSFQSPMMHRMLGGKCMYETISFEDVQHHTLTRGFLPNPQDSTDRAALVFVLERTWLTDQIPALMDSLYRENPHLLFWADSPTNDKWKQSIGIVADKDTLWWVGKRTDVTIELDFALWPFENILIKSKVERFAD